MTSRVRRIGVAAATATLVLLAIPLGAGAHGLHLDFGFGRRGLVLSDTVTRTGFGGEASGIRLAKGMDGRLVVGVDDAIREYLPSGKPDPGFGSGGRIEIERPGNSGFSFSQVAVDRKGRVLVAGTTLHFPPQSSPISEVAAPTTIGRASATILRYRPNGSLDPSFGDDGVLETDFGFPAPINQVSGLPFEEPVTRITDLALDSRGRIIVLGNADLEYRDCGEVRSAFGVTLGGFVARLAPNGQPDSTFGDGAGRSAGVVALGERNAGRWLTIAPGDEPTLYSANGGCGGLPAVMSRLRSGGGFDRGFGANGWLPLPSGTNGKGSWRARALALDGAGRIFLLGSSSSRSMPIERLLASGRRDRRFGRDGRALVSLPRHSRLAGLAPDGRGGVWAFGSARKGSHRSSFLLTGLNPAGRDLGQPRVGPGLPREDRFCCQESGLVDRRGRVVMAGEFTNSGGSKLGVALVRYLP